MSPFSFDIYDLPNFPRCDKLCTKKLGQVSALIHTNQWPPYKIKECHINKLESNKVVVVGFP